MSTKHKNIILTVLMAAVLFSLSFACWFRKPDDFSASERRELAKFPAMTWNTVFSGKFVSEFEPYTQDQFPLRDSFRSLKAVTVLGPFCQLDNNRLYMEKGYISKLEYPLKETMLDHSSEHFSYLYDTYMADKDMKVYFSIIPDKNYFLATEYGALALDYPELIAYMRQRTDYMEYIDITRLLDIEDYYRTDTHWRQERITDVAELLAEKMGTSVKAEYKINTLDQPFYGVYYGQFALPVAPDTLKYLTNETLDRCTVTGPETGTPVSVELYDMGKAEGKDPYEMFLSGTQPLLIIENPDAGTEKELILFRDSFGSSLAPLLAEGYAKITVVDTRYVSGSLLGDLIEFEDQDVLFLYSTMLLNNSLAFK